MKKTVDTRQYLDMVCQLLAEGHSAVPVPVAGSSMTPFLHHGDMVYLSLADSPLKKGDIVLYTRPGGRYILHRIVAVRADGSFTMLGDAQNDREHIESASQIHARVVRALHKGKVLTPSSPRWWFFRYIWPNMVPLRLPLMKLIAKFKKGTAD